VMACANLATTSGYNMFSLQAGGYCYGGTYPVDNYARYGAASSCDALGSAGKNQVYVTCGYQQCRVGLFSTTTLSLGCWNLGPSLRNLPDCLNNGQGLSVEACQSLAVAVNDNIFGLQWAGQCWGGKEIAFGYIGSGFNQYGLGATDLCFTKGGDYTNQVYGIWKFLGCFWDLGAEHNGQIHSMVPLNPGVTMSLEACARLATGLYDTIALNNGGYCYGGYLFPPSMTITMAEVATLPGQSYSQWGRALPSLCPLTGGVLTNMVYTLGCPATKC